MVEDLTPLYVHDCDKCTFIACCTLGSRVVDIYKSCDKSFGSGFIIRYSSDGPDYKTVHKHSSPYSTFIRNGEQKTILSMDYYLCQKIESFVSVLRGA